MNEYSSFSARASDAALTLQYEQTVVLRFGLLRCDADK